ncbi:MAG: PAS domain S-box protein [Nitrospirales bacterium]
MPQLESPFNLEILDHLPQGIFILRQDGTVVFWNHCLEEWTGVSKAAVVGHPLVTHFPRLGTPHYTSRFEPLFTGGPLVTFASQFHPQFLLCTLPNGQPRIQQTIAKSIWNEPNQEWQALVIIQDIADRYRQVPESQRIRKQARPGIVERKKAEATMLDQNRLLALDAKVGQIINHTQELQPLLQQCTQAIVTHLNAAFARIWTLNPNQQILELQASAGLYTHLDGPHGRVPVGQFKIGKIAAEKKPHLTNSVIGDPRVSDQEWAKREGMVAFAGYPLLKSEEVVGVMALFAKHPLTSLTLESLAMVGDRITTAIDRQQARQAHHDLFLQHERILASAGEGIFGLDLEGRTTFVNPAATKMLAYEPEELIGVPMHATVHHTRSDGEPYPRETCPMYAAFKDGAIHQIEDEILWRKDGRSFPIAYTSRPIHDEQGQIVGAVVTFKDITERKQMEKARASFQRAIDQAIEGLSLLDQQGKYTYINRAHAEMYGYTVNDLVGQSWKTLYSKEQVTDLEETCFPTLGLSGQWQGELIGLRKNGTHFPVEITLSLLSSEHGTPSGFIWTCRDITERQQAEALIKTTTHTLEQQNQELAHARDQALAAARSKSEFLATMSHEIRTPLNGVIGMTDLLLGTDLDADQHEMLETLKHSGEFLLTLINDILDFSKIDAGKLDLEVIDFDIRTAVDEVLDTLAERANQKNLELISLIYATTPLKLRGDPGRIRQILFNLIGNAIKFTQGGEIVVDVSVVGITTDTTTLRFAVTDTGIGIDTEAQVRLFELFTQADSSTTRKFGGTGLGLAICKQLVTLMHGEIGVISDEGDGSTFWFTIPFAHSSSSPPPFSNASLRGRRVCIVESNDTIRFLLQHYAESWGMACEVAQNGHDGFALLRQHAKGEQSFDIAILDHTLAETIQEDGLSLATRIRQNLEISHIPLILLTTFGKRGEGKFAQHASFNSYLTKPIRHQQLQQCLKMILGTDQQTPSSHTSHASSLITRPTLEAAQAHTKVHILLAEDNVVNQKVAVRMLQKLGYHVDGVENGQEAVNAVGCTSYDLVLMDCQMPETDGIEATRKIREAESLNDWKAKVRSKGQEPPSSEISPSSLHIPHGSRVPIIALTANAFAGDRQACLDAGMDDFLSKPVKLKELSTMITKWVPPRPTSEEASMVVPEKNSAVLPSSPTSLDDGIIQDLQSLGGEEDQKFFLTVMDQFLADLPRHLESIKQAVERQDAAALVKAAHACKGSSRSMGAILLADISYALEMMGREGTMGEVSVKFSQWLQEKDRTVLALQQERIHHTASAPSTPHS